MGPHQKKMRSTHILLSLGLILGLLSVVLMFLPEENSAQNEPVLPNQLNECMMSLREGMSISPEELDANADPQAIVIPNGYRATGLFGYGIITMFGRTEWMEVGSWHTQPLRERLYLGGKAEFTIYAYNEENSVDTDIEFSVGRANEAQPLASVIKSQRIAKGTDRTPISASLTFPAGNDTTIEAGSEMVFRIKARCNGGAVMSYGNPVYPSGFSFFSNALSIHALYMDKESVTVEYKDSFMVNYARIKAVLTLDREEIQNQHMDTQLNTYNQTREMSWHQDIGYGAHEVMVSLSYDSTGLRNVSMMQTITLSKPRVDDLQMVINFFKGSMKWIILIILIIVALVMYGRYRKKRWNKRFKSLEPSARPLSKHKKKKMWKRMKKERKREKRDRRKIEKEEVDEKEQEAEGFSIFKKKTRKDPMPEKATALEIDDTIFDDIEFD